MPEQNQENIDEPIIPVAIPTPVYLDTATVKIKPVDQELLISNETIDYEADEHAYLGGRFDTNENDYVEVLIYDTNNNFLESGVVDKSDYYYDEEKKGIKLKTGTILRKMGYDRGRFVVRYNFLRRLAGSHETVLVNRDGTLAGDTPDLNELNKTIFLKENKYLIHKISDSRTELRLVSQNIREEKYLRDFYRLSSKSRKLRADHSGESVIEFKGTAEQKPTSKTIGFVNPSGWANPAGRWDKSMVGGSIMIPNFFLRKMEYPKIPPTGDDVGITNTETINDTVFQASFFLSTIEGVEKKNTSGQFGDKKFLQPLEKFKGLTDNSTVSSIPGVDFATGGNTLNTVTNLSDSTFNVPYMKWKQGDSRPIIIIESNSFIPADVPTSYTWEVTGYDNDSGNYERVQPKFDSSNTDTGGNIEIISQTGFAQPSNSNLLRAVDTITPDTDTPRPERQGSRIKIRLWGKDLHVGIKLTVTTNVDNRSSTLHLPAIIETD